ncbi:MAG TPA: type II toxin-antitoxin system prevent-host-death family antitoxin [Rickettsia endosymbiont of Columbicola hoogstraali]|nr:type II toxin-antitoxin system prevent-host-death family antitoxin [Rickettsia endosymbiont of Columbicola hoogstraali]
MEQLNTTEAKREFGELLIKAQIKPISIIKNGKPVAVIISNNEFKELEAFKEQFLKIAIAEGINDISQGKIHSHKSVFDSLKIRINE